MKPNLFLAAILAAMLPLGCADVELPIAPPSCSSSKSLKIVDQIFWGKVDKKQFDRAVESDVYSMLAMEFAAPSDYNEKIQKYTCTGRLVLSIDGSDAPDERDVDGAGAESEAIQDLVVDINQKTAVFCRDGKCAVQLEYTSQLVDGQHFVGVSGLMDWLPYVAGMQSSLRAYTKTTVWTEKAWPKTEPAPLKTGGVGAWIKQSKADFKKGFDEVDNQKR